VLFGAWIMETFATTTALLAAVLNGVAAGVGGVLWWRVDPRPWVWPLVRAGQAAAVLLALTAGVAFISGARPDEGLFWLYAVLPVAIGFFAEQFRILAAQTVLEARGLEDAKAVGRLPEGEQRSVVLQIVRRELGVMALAAGVIMILALRAVAETPGL
jgi:hypothetical protein